MVRELIQQSWKRSKKYKLSPDSLQIPSVSDSEIKKRIQLNIHIIELLEEYVVPLRLVLKDKDYAMGFVDTDGVIVKEFSCLEELQDAFVLGNIWKEHTVGTTAVAIALDTEKVAIVDLEEHFCTKFKSVIVIAHPIIVYGNILGVLVLALKDKDGLDYLSNLMSVLISRVEEKLILQDSFFSNLKEGKTLEEVLRTFIHEIKNPLTNIRAFLQLQQLKSEEHAGFDKMIKEVDRISDIIENFRYLSIQKNRTLIRLNLTELIKNIYDIADNMFRLKGYHISLKANEECYIIGDANKLKQVFINLIKNAYEALGDRGTVEINVEKSDQECMIKFIDDGEGISSESFETIFQPFYTTKPHGYGLGLSVAQEILTYHKGILKIESEKYKGTTVIVTLPIVQ